jgi:hypothetical protein
MRPRRIGVLSLLLLPLLVTPSVRSAATPGSGMKSAQLTQSSQEGRDFIVRDITIDPGGGTGWHWHDGIVVGAVKQGTLTHYSADCSIDGVYNPGDLGSHLHKAGGKATSRRCRKPRLPVRLITATG